MIESRVMIFECAQHPSADGISINVDLIIRIRAKAYLEDTINDFKSLEKRNKNLIEQWHKLDVFNLHDI